MDNIIISVPALAPKTLKNLGLDWFRDGENHDYLSNDFVIVDASELAAFQKAAEEVHRIAIEAAQYIASNNLWHLAGIPTNAIDLVKYSLEQELDFHLIGRFDFSGGINGKAIKLLEYNADTCSLMPETALIQDKHWQQEKRRLSGTPYNDLIKSLQQQFEQIIIKNPDKTPRLLVSTLGHEEDWLNTDIIRTAALDAGFAVVDYMVLDKVIFSPDEGFFIELGPEEFVQYDFWFKFVPWEFIAYEEPDLMDTLTKIVLNNIGVVINPAYSMLLQSKAIMKYMYDLAPYNPYLLKTTFDENDFTRKYYVRKPIFGRMGENIAFYEGQTEPIYETEGDYGNFPPVFQELAGFNLDSLDNRYQPSIYWSGQAAALCFRRQDDFIIDDDAEFVGHVVD